MLTKDALIEKSRELGFVDIGFTTAEVFESQQEVLRERHELYAWAAALDLPGGTDPKSFLEDAKSIVVLLEGYFREGFPTALERHFGRCYLDDDRVTGGGLSRRIQEFLSYLGEHEIQSATPFGLPHRLAAARAGLGTFGKNCLFYSRRAARGSSWVLPVAVVVNQEFPPDAPTSEVGCPDWCRNTCIVACPTQALKAPRKIDPRRCISYLSYYGEGITPMELREPMGLWVYGCDHCQNVCPRNQPWQAQDLPVNEKVAAKVGDFDLSRLLHMDVEHYQTRVWPHMFYMPREDPWRWKMNAARVMGNTLDERYIPDLARTLAEEDDPRVAGMAAWALGRIGGPEARAALESLAERTDMNALTREEIALALGQC